MPFNTIEWIKGKIKIIDQTQLPHKLKYLYCEDIETLREAISSLRVRGAPALGIAGALGVLLGVRNSPVKDYPELKKEIEKIITYLGSSRPTAVNLFWGLRRMLNCAEKNKDKDIKTIKNLLEREALQIIEEDKACNRLIGKNGASLINDGDTILTHCNAGALATADYGTALGIIYKAKEEGKRVKVYVDETRPLLQGARLTTWELMQEGIETILICDNTAGEVMREKKISKVLVGADRVAANGDVANKIGTYTLAVLAKENKIPFYIACPISTIDFSLPGGEKIPIEERSASEVREFLGRKIAPHVKVYNLAFDVTPAEYITGIITEKGIYKPPYKESLKELNNEKRDRSYSS
ncbi:S-methyl-5-thioribose-1-phosphate isomerase [Candidatus Aerophobetes bacterium]|nr:S-methyl-5-thioribose-1-phosphate isomerase [Candidatus Aerophobetes bacterium]